MKAECRGGTMGLVVFLIYCPVGCANHASDSQEARAQPIARAQRPARRQANAEAIPPTPRREAIRGETPAEEAARRKLQATSAAPAQDVSQQQFHSGELAKGEQALEAALAAHPEDDQLRFGLGVLRFVRGVDANVSKCA